MRTASIDNFKGFVLLVLLSLHLLTWLYQSDISDIPKQYLDAMNNHGRYFYATFYFILWVLGWICSSNTSSLFFRISVGLLQETCVFVIMCKLTKMNMVDWGLFEHVGFFVTIIFTIFSVKYMNKINSLILLKIPKHEIE